MVRRSAKKTRVNSGGSRRSERQRRLSFDENLLLHDGNPSLSIGISNSTVQILGVDYRTLREKIDDLKKKCEEWREDSTSEEYLQTLVLLQLYSQLEFGEISIENAEAYLKLSQFYLDREHLVLQATTHVENARRILKEFLLQKPVQYLPIYLSAFEIHQYSMKCSLIMRSQQNSIKLKPLNKDEVPSIDLDHIHEDLQVMEDQLKLMQPLMTSKDYDERTYVYRRIKFDFLTDNPKEFHSSVSSLFDEIVTYFDHSRNRNQIEFYLRAAWYWNHFDESQEKAQELYTIAKTMAKDQHTENPTLENQDLLANVYLQWGRARMRNERFDGMTEKKFLQALKLFRGDKQLDDKNALQVIDELVIFYTKTENYQAALDILSPSLSEKQREFGEFSEEVIQTRSRLGAIYLRECDYLNAAEHLTKCLELQEFVYGKKDKRTGQTQQALEILKKDPRVFRKYFAHTQPPQKSAAFSVPQKISYSKEDRQVLLSVKEKPPIIPKKKD